MCLCVFLALEDEREREKKRNRYFTALHEYLMRWNSEKVEEEEEEEEETTSRKLIQFAPSLFGASFSLSLSLPHSRRRSRACN